MGQQKVGLLGLEFGGSLGWNLSGVGIQIVGSSWAKKNDYFETEKWWCGVVLYFVRVYYHFVIARFQKLRETNDNRWFYGRGGNFGVVGVISILSSSSS